MADNGKPDGQTVAELEAELLNPESSNPGAKLVQGLGGKIRVDPDQLTPRDLRRARVALDGRNPFELLDDPLDRVVLTIWCLVSRDDPSFSWDQAEDMPFSRLDTAGEDAEPDPQTAPPGSPGPEAAPPAATGSSRKRRAGASKPS